VETAEASWWQHHKKSIQLYYGCEVVTPTPSINKQQQCTDITTNGATVQAI
jgi:hypothetical protein